MGHDRREPALSRAGDNSYTYGERRDNESPLGLEYVGMAQMKREPCMELGHNLHKQK